MVTANQVYEKRRPIKEMERNSREEGDPFFPGLKEDIFGWWDRQLAGQVKLTEK